MKIPLSRTIRVNSRLPALVVVGSCIATLPASALELGDLTVQSRIGQPLRASIAFALAPNEQLSGSCVSLSAGIPPSGLPGIGRATLSIANGVILLTGANPVREPMIATQVIVDCPYTPKIQREYMLFVDPIGVGAPVSVAASTASGPTAIQPTNVQQTNVQPPTVRKSRRAAANREPILGSTRYRVLPGDSLSEIAQRVEHESIGLWPAVEAIFQANPRAFMGNDPNRLKAGSWLDIPIFDGSNPVTTDAALAEAAPAPGVAYEPTFSDVAPVEDVAPVAETADVVAEPDAVDVIEGIPVADSAVETTTDDLRPGDIVLDYSSYEAPTVSTDIIITDTQIDNPAAGSSSTSWFVWLAGSGAALILALLVFGRRIRGLFGSTPVGPAARAERRSAVHDAINDNSIEDEIDEATAEEAYDLETYDLEAYDLADNSPTTENPALDLDADLFSGSGLEDGTDIDVAQDFGFAATTGVDIDLPFEPVAAGPESNPVLSDETDMLPTMPSEDPSILESEVLPQEEDDYDMSVIMDATKMPQPEDVTQQDLRAIEVSTGDETVISENYTVNSEIDYKIIEQDYEDEMTATQALNAEIARAALEITDSSNDESDTAVTAEMPLATVIDLDTTAQIPDKSVEGDTAEMPVKSGKGT